MFLSLLYMYACLYDFTYLFSFLFGQVRDKGKDAQIRSLRQQLTALQMPSEEDVNSSKDDGVTTTADVPTTSSIQDVIDAADDVDIGEDEEDYETDEEEDEGELEEDGQKTGNLGDLVFLKTRGAKHPNLAVIFWRHL